MAISEGEIFWPLLESSWCDLNCPGQDLDWRLCQAMHGQERCFELSPCWWNSISTVFFPRTVPYTHAREDI